MTCPERPASIRCVFGISSIATSNSSPSGPAACISTPSPYFHPVVSVDVVHQKRVIVVTLTGENDYGYLSCDS